MSEIKERPILFNGEMVRAVLDGRKTQTRRVINPQPDGDFDGPTIYAPTKISRDGEEHPGPEVMGIYCPHGEWGVRCPYGKPGDRLWVRETFWTDGDEIIYRADPGAEKDLDPETTGLAWKPSIFMPREACRILLEVAEVRVDQVQDISEEDAWAEGVSGRGTTRSADEGRTLFCQLWDKINFSRGFGWMENPWVWVVDFKVIEVKGGASE
jgi:hypothetical protein